MRIAIVGGGATGTLAAIHIAKHVSGQAVEILLVDPSDEIGRGLAYSTTDPRHLLNVRVSNMSAFPEEPQHLHDWLKAHGGSCPSPFHFISRGRYGDYLSDLAREALDSAAVRHVRDVCVDIVEDRRAVTLRLGSGGAIEADHVILATGNDAKPAVNGFPAEQPWTPGSLEGLPQDASILVIGSGLTMVDMLLSLDRRGHRGPVVAVSRRGLLPSAHRLTAAHNFRSDEIPFGADLSKLLAWLRLRSAELTANGADWRSAVDALRPYTQRLWREMTLDQRRRFLRHVRVYWEAHRHRMAPEIEQALGRLVRDGRLTIIGGRVIAVRQDADRLRVQITRRGSKDPEEGVFARIIDCTGLTDDPLNSTNPLLRALLARGSLRPDAVGIGFDVAENYAIVGADGARSQRVKAIGPLARAAFWECIAIPDIRIQCKQIAEAMADAARDRVKEPAS